MYVYVRTSIAPAPSLSHVAGDASLPRPRRRPAAPMEGVDDSARRAREVCACGVACEACVRGEACERRETCTTCERASDDGGRRGTTRDDDDAEVVV